IGIGFILAWAIILGYADQIVANWQGMSIVDIIEHKSLVVVFWIVWVILAIMGYKYNFSLLPVIGILINLYLMSELGASNWIIFIAWLLIGLVFYFAYGYKNSKLNERANLR